MTGDFDAIIIGAAILGSGGTTSATGPVLARQAASGRGGPPSAPRRSAIATVHDARAPSGAKLKKLREALVAAGMRDEPIKPDWPAEGKFSGVHRERQVDAAQKLYGAIRRLPWRRRCTLGRPSPSSSFFNCRRTPC